MEEKIKNSILNFYKKNHKILLVFPVLILFFSIFLIFDTYKKEGFIFERDVSLKGGVSINIYERNNLDQNSLQKLFEEKFLDSSFEVKTIEESGENVGFIIDSDLDEQSILNFLKENGFEAKEENYFSNYISQTLSNSFLVQAGYTLLFSFVLMSIVVFAYFRKTIPSICVILSAIFDIVVLIGVLNLLDFKVGIAGVGAIIMIIGYSIDTDILLTNRLLKEKNIDYFESFYDAFITGNLMSLTTLLSALFALFFTNSQIIFDICFILVLGILIDYISTWVQNSGLLLIYLEKQN